MFKGSVLSHDFSMIDLTSLSNVKVYYKLKDVEFGNPYEYGKVGYRLKCLGGEVI